MNFVETFLQGKSGLNVGITTGLPKLDVAINGIQRKMSVGVAAAPKVGKTTLTDFAFVISPYLYMLETKQLDNIEWIYWSLEIDRINKEFKYAAFFMAYDHKVYNISYKNTLYPMSQDYLMGRLLHLNSDGSKEQVPILEQHEALLKQVYVERIIPIFGQFDANGKRILKGKIEFIEEPDNPTGMNKYLLHHADQNGTFTHEKYQVREDDGKGGKKVVEKSRIVGYKPRNPQKYTIVITDHIRKLRLERGFTLKQNIDKWLEYSTLIRNICQYTFIQVCHANRQLGNIDRLKFAGEWVFPSGDDVKDSGNLSEECTVLLTMFNPNDEKYNLDRHFGVDLTNNAHPNYRSLHIVESRYTFSPQHIQVNMLGGINTFTDLLNTY